MRTDWAVGKDIWSDRKFQFELESTAHLPWFKSEDNEGALVTEL